MSGVGSPIDVLTDVLLSTPPAFASGPEEYVNEASLQNYITHRMKQGRELSQMLQGGETIRDDIIFGIDSSRQFYNPNEPLNYKLVNILTQHSTFWTFCVTSISYTEQQLGLNFGQLRSSAQKKVFKKLYSAYMTNLWTDISNGEEEDAWRQPSVLMEQSGSKTPQSLPHFCNEFTNGLAPGITTVQQLSPVTFPKWKPFAHTYAPGASNTTLYANLFSALTRTWRSMTFGQMPHGAMYSDSATRPDFIAASLRGVHLYEDALRGSNEMLLAGKQDPAYPDPQFRGMPVHYFPQLDNALIHLASAGAAFGSEVTATFTGPRFMLVNTRYGKRIWHEDHYMDKRAPFSPSKQPFTKIMLVDSWGNYFCNSRRKFAAIVSPSANVSGGALTDYSYAIAA